MIIYKGKYLTIQYEEEKDRFIQYWTNSPNSLDSFKDEMLTYTKYYEKIKPIQSLWLQQNFKLNLDKDSQRWIENNVNIPCKKYGNRRLAFVVSKDVLAHISVINSFEEIDSCIYPKHFATEKEARIWLDNEKDIDSTQYNTEITFEGTDENGNPLFKIKTDSSDLTKTISSLKDIIDKNIFLKKNCDKYLSLTKQERNILRLYSKGLNSTDISDILFISLNTTRTHWRNIKQKLNIRSKEKLLLFAKTFNLRKH